MSYRVIILDGPGGPENLEEAELAPLGATVLRPGAEAVAVQAVLPEADAILCDSTPITADLLDLAPRLLVVAEYGIGYDNIDVGAASQRGIWVTNVPGFCADEVADHTMALLLAAARRLLPLDRSVRAGGWDAIGVAGAMPRLATKTLGLVGFGMIGQRVARRARAFGLTVLATSPHLTDALAEDHGVQRADLPALLSRSDFVSLHLPAGPATRHLIDGAALARMQPTAWLINTARGSLVDEPALARALRNGQLAGAALDVRATEPPTAPDPLADCPNLILTPHAAYYSTASLVELRQRAARNVAAVLTGDPPPNPINPYLVPRAERRRAGDGGLWV